MLLSAHQAASLDARKRSGAHSVGGGGDRLSSLTMTAALAIKRVSYAEYLRMEARSDVRLEFVDGYAYAMTGGTPRHARLTMRAARLLGASLDGSPCEPYSSDLKVHIAEAHRSTYPDITVVCGEPEPSKIDRNAVVNPTVIVEILSPSTEADDRGDRWDAYQQIPSLIHYVLVSQDEKRIEVFSRDEGGWRYEGKRGRGTVKLSWTHGSKASATRVHASLSIDALYKGIALPKLRRRPAAS